MIRNCQDNYCNHVPLPTDMKLNFIDECLPASAHENCNVEGAGAEGGRHALYRLIAVFNATGRPTAGIVCPKSSGGSVNCKDKIQ